MIAEEDAVIRSVGIGRRMQWTFASDGEKGLRTGPHAKRRFPFPSTSNAVFAYFSLLLFVSLFPLLPVYVFIAYASRLLLLLLPRGIIEAKKRDPPRAKPGGKTYSPAPYN